MTSAGLFRGSFGRSIHASLSISVAFVAQFFEITYKFMRSWMARCTARGAWALLLAVCSACASDPGGGDQDNGPAGGDGSGSGGAGRGGSAGTSGESSGGGEAGRGCAAANTPERLVDIHRLAGDLRVTRAGVFFLSAPMSALNRSQVRRLAENGTEDEIVYTATMGALTSLAVDETHLYVLERDVLVKARFARLDSTRTTCSGSRAKMNKAPCISSRNSATSLAKLAAAQMVVRRQPAPGALWRAEVAPAVRQAW